MKAYSQIMGCVNLKHPWLLRLQKIAIGDAGFVRLGLRAGADLRVCMIAFDRGPSIRMRVGLSPAVSMMTTVLFSLTQLRFCRFLTARNAHLKPTSMLIYVLIFSPCSMPLYLLGTYAIGRLGSGVGGLLSGWMSTRSDHYKPSVSEFGVSKMKRASHHRMLFCRLAIMILDIERERVAECSSEDVIRGESA